MKASLGAQAVSIQADEIQKTRQLDTQAAINKWTSYIYDSGDYETAIAEMGKIVNQTDSFTSPAEKQIVLNKTFESAAEAKLDNLFDNAQLDEVEAFLGNEGFAKWLPPEKQQAYREAVTKQKQQFEKMRFTDPAAYSNFIGATTPEAKAATQGGDPSRAVMLTNDQAKKLALSVNRIESTPQVLAFMDDLEKQYGKYTPNAVNDLVKAGLPPQYIYMLNLAQSDKGFDGKVANAEQIDMAFKIARSRQQGKDIIALAKEGLGSDKTGFVEDFNSAFDDMSRIYQMEGKEQSIGFIKQQTLNIAYGFYNQYRDSDKAISLAIQGLQNGNQIVEESGQLFRLPLNSNKNLIMQGLEIALEKDVAVYDENKELRTYKGNKVKEFGRWSANDDMSGLVLKALNGEPLMYADGRIIEYKYSELEDMANQREQQRKAKMLETPAAGIVAAPFGLGEDFGKPKKPEKVIKKAKAPKKAEPTNMPPVLPTFREKGRNRNVQLQQFIDELE